MMSHKFLKTYDKPGTLFFLDPPYYKASYYNHNFELSDYHELANALTNLKSHFILSISDHPEMRNIFKKFEIRKVNLSYSAARNNIIQSNELIISSI